MTLAAAQVKAAVVARLVAAGTAAGARVYTYRAWPLGESELPALRVVSQDEPIESDDVTWPQQQEHTLALAVKGLVKDTADLAGAMDALAEEILTALGDTQAHATLAPLVGCNVLPRGIRRADQQGGGEAAIGEVTVAFDVTFQTSADDPSTLI